MSKRIASDKCQHGMLVVLEDGEIQCAMCDKPYSEIAKDNEKEHSKRLNQ